MIKITKIAQLHLKHYFTNPLLGVATFPSSVRDAIPGGYGWYLSLLSLFTGVTGAEISTCFSHGITSAQLLDEEDRANRRRKGEGQFEVYFSPPLTSLERSIGIRQQDYAIQNKIHD